jgi:hypothetical protein
MRTFLPLIPPAALISPSARSMPSRASTPKAASPPESERYAPMGISASDLVHATSDGESAAAQSAAAVAENILRDHLPASLESEPFAIVRVSSDVGVAWCVSYHARAQFWRSSCGYGACAQYIALTAQCARESYRAGRSREVVRTASPTAMRPVRSGTAFSPNNTRWSCARNVESTRNGSAP